MGRENDAHRGRHRLKLMYLGFTEILVEDVPEQEEQRVERLVLSRDRRSPFNSKIAQERIHVQLGDSLLAAEQEVGPGPHLEAAMVLRRDLILT